MKNQEPRLNLSSRSTPLRVAIMRYLVALDAFSPRAAVSIAPIQYEMSRIKLSDPVTPKGVNATLSQMYTSGLVARWRKPEQREYSYYLPGPDDYREALPKELE